MPQNTQTIPELRASLRRDRVRLGALALFGILVATPRREPRLLFYFINLPRLHVALDFAWAFVGMTEVALGLYMAFGFGGLCLSGVQGKLRRSKLAVQCRLDDTLLELNRRKPEVLVLDERQTLLSSARRSRIKTLGGRL